MVYLCGVCVEIRGIREDLGLQVAHSGVLAAAKAMGIDLATDVHPDLTRATELFAFPLLLVRAHRLRRQKTLRKGSSETLSTLSGV